MRIQIDPRYGLLTVAYLMAIYRLSSIPDLGAPGGDPLVLLVMNLAHAPLFAGLAFCVLNSISGAPEIWWARYALAFVVTGACAALDEWHQSFTPGRYSSAGDLLVDLAGITAVLVFLRLHAVRRERRAAGAIARWDRPGTYTAPPPRMRVCHIMSADLWAGAEIQVATVASYLVERPDLELTAVLLNDGPLARELRRLAVPVTIIDEHQNNAVKILIFLIRFFRNHPVEVVHTHRYKDTVLGAIAAKLAGVPCVIRTVHGRSEPMRGWEWARFRTYEALDKLVLRCFADRIVAVSRSMAASLEDSGYKRGTVVHIHNGVDLRHVQPTRPRDHVRRELGIGPGTPLIGTVGRLSPVKGHTYFLGAARLILQKEHGARFLIVGDGPLRGELANCARRLRIDQACLFVGPRTDVYDLVAAMDVFVLPSLDEGIPMALLEAMALGRPVVATAVGGVPEIVAHRASGLLVESRNEYSLAEACLELTLDPGWAQTLGARARLMVEEAFSHEQNGLALVNAYRAIACGRWAPGARPSARERARGLLTRGADRFGASADGFSSRPRRRPLSSPHSTSTANKA
jgi:glycosyltransferase involved in cell wall biosynthesis/VanZ family protein